MAPKARIILKVSYLFQGEEGVLALKIIDFKDKEIGQLTRKLTIYVAPFFLNFILTLCV